MPPWLRRVGLVLVVACGYVALVIRYHVGTPVLSRNLAREFNQVHAGVPDAERGVTTWLRLRAILGFHDRLRLRFSGV